MGVKFLSNWGLFENCNVLGYGVETLLMAGCKMSTSDRFGPPTVI